MEIAIFSPLLPFSTSFEPKLISFAFLLSTHGSIRSVTLILRPMAGVAHSTSSELDEDHKEIHCSTGYLADNASVAREEIYGVVIHEMVHCFQYNAQGTCPSGLIEGIAGKLR